MEHSIEIAHLCKSFGDVKAVQDLSFAVRRGELFAFLGVNGAGKSTTISILCGQLRKDSGTVRVAGQNIEDGMAPIARRLGVVFQNSVLDSALTVRENLQSRAALYGITGSAFKERLSELCALLELTPLLSRTVGKLSGGQRRRIDIARALLHRPEILILDEPTTGLDPQTRHLLWQVVQTLRQKENMTVLLTTHYMEEASMAQQLCIMDAGKIIASGSPSQLKNKYASDTLKIYTDKITPLNRELAALSLASYRLPNGIAIPLSTTKDALHIMPRITTPYDGIEIIQGSMDDAFIQITGKKLED